MCASLCRGVGNLPEITSTLSEPSGSRCLSGLIACYAFDRGLCWFFVLGTISTHLFDSVKFEVLKGKGKPAAAMTRRQPAPRS